MEGSATSSSLQVLCSSSSGPHHHGLRFHHHHQLRVVARFHRFSPSGIRLTSHGKAATPTARCCSNNSKGVSPKDPPHARGDEEEEEEEVEKLMGEIVRDKCKEDEGKGVAGLLECLEREAIMGDDNGKQPTDYNRRAQIFHRSSRVFQDQALHPHHTSPSP